MPKQEQASHELKHLDLLRKLLASGQCWEINFEGKDWNAHLRIEHGMLEGEGEAVALLRQVIEKPVLRFRWNPSKPKIVVPMEAKMVFTRALAGLHLHHVRAAVFRQCFSKLPPVRLKAAIIFRLNPKDFHEYQVLYQMGLAERGANLGSYLDITDADMMLRKLRIVITCYCLGYFLPVAQRSVARVSRPVGFASRILARLRAVA